jgi:hypothetical protein
MKKKKNWLHLLFVMILLMACSPSLVAAETAASRVIYQPDTDMLTIVANDVTLRSLLAAIALQTGVEVSMTPEAEKNISCSFTDQPLASGLKKLAHAADVNHMLIYGGSKDRPLIIGMKVLHRESRLSGHLKLVRPSEFEGNLNPGTQSQKTSETDTAQVSVHEIVQQRWQERRKNMPPEKYEKAEARKEKRLKQREARTTQRQEKKKEQEAERAEQRAKKQAEEEALMIENPERYQQVMQNREERKALYLEQLSEE